MASGDLSRFQYMVDDEQRDLYSTGGDILMDCKGNILYVYRSKTLDDRPAIQEILDAIPPCADGDQNLDLNAKFDGWYGIC